MVPPVQSQEHVGGKSHLILKKLSKSVGKCWQENLVKGVHHEQCDVEENHSWVAFEKWGAVLHEHNMNNVGNLLGLRSSLNITKWKTWS